MAPLSLYGAVAALSRAAGSAGHLVHGSGEKGFLLEVREGREEFYEAWSEESLELLLDAGGGRIGSASAQLGPGFDPGEVIERARLSASVATPDGHRLIGPVALPARRRALGLCDPAGWLDAGREGLTLAARLEKAALVVAGAANVRKPTFEAVSERHVLFSGAGKVADWRESSFGLQVEVAAGQGDNAQSGWASGESRRLSGLDPEAVGSEAGNRAAELLNPREAPNGLFPSLIDRRVSAEALELLGGALCADAHRKKTSFFLGKVGEKLFPETVTIIDDGLLRGGPATSPVDDEGTPCGRTVVIDRGRVAALLYDRAEASRAGRQSTGNGFADGGMPAPGTTNFFLANGRTPVPELVSSIKRGLWVREVLGLHTADPVTGEFSVGCAGLWIEKGRVSHPVTGAVISGDVPGLFSRVIGVGDDFAFTGAHGSPSVLIEKLRVSGS